MYEIQYGCINLPCQPHISAPPRPLSPRSTFVLLCLLWQTSAKSRSRALKMVFCFCFSLPPPSPKVITQRTVTMARKAAGALAMTSRAAKSRPTSPSHPRVQSAFTVRLDSVLTLMPSSASEQSKPDTVQVLTASSAAHPARSSTLQTTKLMTMAAVVMMMMLLISTLVPPRPLLIGPSAQMYSTIFFNKST